MQGLSNAPHCYSSILASLWLSELCAEWKWFHSHLCLEWWKSQSVSGTNVQLTFTSAIPKIKVKLFNAASNDVIFYPVIFLETPPIFWNPIRRVYSDFIVRVSPKWVLLFSSTSRHDVLYFVGNGLGCHPVIQEQWPAAPGQPPALTDLGRESTWESGVESCLLAGGGLYLIFVGRAWKILRWIWGFFMKCMLD